MRDRPILDWQVNSSYKQDRIFSALGHLPTYILADDKRDCITQIDERSESGWATLRNQFGQEWHLYADNELSCNTMPALVPAAMAHHMGETVLAYPARLVVVVHSNNSFSVARII